MALQHGLDFGTFHRYGVPDFAAYIGEHVASVGPSLHLPFFLGEFGINTDGSTDGTTWWTNDSANVHVHNALWVSAVSATAGGAMHWWWHEFDDHDAYKEFAPVRRFVNMIPLLNHSWTAFTLTPTRPRALPGMCNTTAIPESHFDTAVGTVVSHSLGTDASACEQACCLNMACDGWVFTTSQVYE